MSARSRLCKHQAAHDAPSCPAAPPPPTCVPPRRAQQGKSPADAAARDDIRSLLSEAPRIAARRDVFDAATAGDEKGLRALLKGAAAASMAVPDCTGHRDPARACRAARADTACCNPRRC